jgi:hypothetical protein
MLVYSIGSLAGRIATLLCVVVVALPYLLRRNRLSRGLGLAQGHARPYLRRLRPHFWVGYFILGLSVVHAGTVMGAMGRANGIGIVPATGAFFLLLFEIALGLNLKDTRLATRRPVRRLHFWTMVGFAGALGLHLWLNG